MARQNYTNTLYDSPFYIRVEVIGGISGENVYSANVSYTHQQVIGVDRVSKLKAVVNKNPLPYNLDPFKRELSFTQVFNKGDIIEIFLPASEIEKVLPSVLIFSNFADRASKEDVFSKFLAGVCEYLVLIKNYGKGFEGFNLFKNKSEFLDRLKTSFRSGEILTYDSDLGIRDTSNREIETSMFAELLDSGLFTVNFGAKGDIDGISRHIGKVLESGYSGNRYGAYTKKIQTLPFPVFSSLKAFQMESGILDISTTFKKILFIHPGKDFDLDDEAMSYLPSVEAASDPSDDERLEYVKIPIDFNNYEGCFQELRSAELNITRPFTEKTRYFKSRVLPDKFHIDLRTHKFDVVFAKLKSVRQLDVSQTIPIEVDRSEYSLPPLDNEFFKFQITVGPNDDFTGTAIQDVAKFVKERYPWLYDLRLSVYKKGINFGFNTLFPLVNRSFEKTKGTLAQALPNSVNSFNCRLIYFLRGRTVTTPFSANIQTGVFTIDPFPDGIGAVVTPRAFFVDEVGPFQVVNGTPNPRLTQNSKLLWVDLEVPISNDDMLSIYGISPPDAEILRAIAFKVKPITVEANNPVKVYLNTPFEGSIFGGAINAEPHVEDLNHYGFKFWFKNKNEKQPSYSQLYDKDYFVDNNGKDRPVLKMELVPRSRVRIGISKALVSKFYGIHLFASKAVFGTEKDKFLTLSEDVTRYEDRDGFIWFTTAITLTPFQADEPVEIKGIYLKETPYASLSEYRIL